jgi:hypothetical protein
MTAPAIQVDFGRAASIAHRRAVSGGNGSSAVVSEQSRNGTTPHAFGDAPGPAAAQNGSQSRRPRMRPANGSVSASAVPAGAARDSVGPGSIAPADIAPVDTAPGGFASASPVAAKLAGSGRAFARARRADIAKRGGAAAPSSAGARRNRPERGALASSAPADFGNVGAAEAPRVTGLPQQSRVQPSGLVRDAHWSTPAPKVSLSRTNGGNIVSGALVRGADRVTGDDFDSAIRITGESDPVAADDQTPRDRDTARGAVQFPSSRAMPHGQHAGRFAATRRPDAARESGESGPAITGSAPGRGGRVTGDEAGADRRITGDQYTARVRAGAEVVRAKVAPAQTRGGQSVSGCDVEFDPRVTGGMRGREAAVSGSQYATGGEPKSREVTSKSAVTGDVPLHDTAVTGTARGAGREISGTPYYREPARAEAAPAEPVAAIDQRFSVRSPQRTAQLQAQQASPPDSAEDRITGSFSAGVKKVTGNIEFAFRSRLAKPGEVPAHLRVSGEGRASGDNVSGAAWSEQTNVTGTDGHVAVNRNPSLRAGRPQNFAGARYFGKFAASEEPKHLVTGMFGYSSDSAAKVTLSGGAQG